MVPAQTPKRVAVFWYLIFADYAVELIWGALHYGATVNRYGVMAVYGSRLLGFIAVAAAWLIARRRIAWLRWPLAAVILLRLFDLSWRRSLPRLFFLYLPHAVLGLGALYCIFSGVAAAWFARRPPREGRARLIDTASAGVCGGILGLEAAIQVLGMLVALFFPQLMVF